MSESACCSSSSVMATGARHRPHELSGGEQIIATHDPMLIDLADRAVELRDGRIVDGAE